MAGTLAKFLKASLKGWQYASEHQDEAVRIVLSNDTAVAQAAAHQKRMTGEIAKLLGADPKRMGYLEPAAYERTAGTLIGRRQRSGHQPEAGGRLEPCRVRRGVPVMAAQEPGRLRQHPAAK